MKKITIPTKLERALRDVVAKRTPIEAIAPMTDVSEAGTMVVSFNLSAGGNDFEITRHRSITYGKDTVFMTATTGEDDLEGDYEQWPTIVQSVLTRVELFQN